MGFCFFVWVMGGR